MHKESKVKTLEKALDVLACFTLSNSELGVSEIASMLGLYKSNVHNLLSTFEDAGYVEQNPENKKYRLGTKVLELAYIVNGQMDLRKVAAPFLQELSNQTNETVYFGIPRRNRVLYLEATFPMHALPSKSILGDTAPLYCTAIGKAMLAYYAAEQVQAVVQEGLVKITENTITDETVLADELARIRAMGYAIDCMEHEHGIMCVGKALLDRKGEVVAGVSISGPSLRFTEEKMNEYAMLLHKQVGRMAERI